MSNIIDQNVAHHVASILFRYVDKPQEVLLLDGMQEDNILILELKTDARLIVNHHTLTEEEKSVVKVTANDNFIVLNFSNNSYLKKFKNLFESFKSVTNI